MRYPTAYPATWALAAALAGGVATGATLQGQSDQSGAGAIRTAEAPSHSDSAAARAAEPLAGAPAPGTTFRDCSDCPEMVVVPAGKFMMGWDGGDPDEKPAREVVIAKPFAVGKFEVTFDEFNACEANGGCTRFKDAHTGGSKGRRPIVNITWDEARAYAAWLSKKAGKPYRLLSEAEWEYAARAGTTTKYAFGNTITHDQANFSYGKEGEGRTKEVGSYPPNAWGLYDMHGNVWEWVEDCYVGTYQGAPADGTARIFPNCPTRVARGGSWDYQADDIRSSVRYQLKPDWWPIDEAGFRLARSLE
jgi:formylglycine-generating enzyme required for sulfatase activity